MLVVIASPPKADEVPYYGILDFHIIRFMQHEKSGQSQYFVGQNDEIAASPFDKLRTPRNDRNKFTVISFVMLKVR